MKKIILIFIAIFLVFGCDNILENIPTTTNTDTENPYTTGDKFIITYIQQFDKSCHIQFKDEERLLSDRYFGDFNDASQSIKIITDEIILPTENRTYTIFEEYTNETILLNIVPEKGKYITITYFSDGIFAQQSITPPQTKKTF